MSTIAPQAPNQATALAATNAAKSSTALAELNKRNQSMGKDDFLKLLIAQLKNQDPQQPADSAQMAAQLAQFSSVEQLTNIARTLDSQKASQSDLITEVASSTAVNNIGRVITASSDLLELNGSGSETLSITGSGGPATLNIFDATSGRAITSRNMGYLSAGTNDIVVGKALKDLTPGVYRITVTSAAETSTGPFTTAVRGVVSGLERDAKGLTYAVGRLRIPLSAVTAINTK